MKERKTLTDGPPESASDQIEPQTTAIIPFMRGLVANESGEMPDSALVALIRGMMDSSPEIAADFLRGVKDRRAAFSALFQGIESTGDFKGGDWQTAVRKLQGLIDMADIEGKLIEFLEAIKELSKDDPLGYKQDQFVELGKMDSRRVRLLAEATKDRPDLARVLLRMNGAIIRPPISDAVRYEVLKGHMCHGLIQATAEFGNMSATHDLLEVAERTDHMIAEMFCHHSLMNIFRECAKYNDLESLKKIVTLLQGLTGDQRLDSKKTDGGVEPQSVDSDYFKTRLHLGEGADPMSVLLLHGIQERDQMDRQNLDFPLLIALESQDVRVRQFMAELLAGDPTLRQVVGKRLYRLIEKWNKDKKIKSALLEKIKDRKTISRDDFTRDEKTFLWESKNEALHDLGLGYETYITEEIREELSKPDPDYPDSEEAFLEALEAGVQASSLVDYLDELFPKRREVSEIVKDFSEQEEQEVIPPLPGEYSQDCYNRLIELMNLADQMGGSTGHGVEWARMLTMIFDDVDQAITYVQSAAAWALSEATNTSLWRSWDEHSVNWSRLSRKFPPAQTPQVEAIKVAMDFKLPTDRFNIKPWRRMLITHPEVAQYFEMAPDIERHLVEHGQPFPETIETLRKTVLEIVVEKYKLSPQLADRLRGRLQEHEEQPEAEKADPLPSVAVLSAAMPPGQKECFRLLMAIGVFKEASPNLCLERRSHVKGGAPVLNGRVEYNVNFRNDPKLETWDARVFQIQTIKSDDELLLMVDTLKEVGGIPNVMYNRVSFDLFDVPETKKVELVKQLCIAFIYAWPLNKLQDLVLLKGHDGPGLRKAVVSRILKASTLEDIFEVYWNNEPMSFGLGDDVLDLEFEIEKPKDFNSVLDEKAEIDFFVQKCLEWLEENGGKAKDLGRIRPFKRSNGQLKRSNGRYFRQLGQSKS